MRSILQASKVIVPVLLALGMYNPSLSATQLARGEHEHHSPGNYERGEDRDRNDSHERYEDNDSHSPQEEQAQRRDQEKLRNEEAVHQANMRDLNDSDDDDDNGAPIIIQENGTAPSTAPTNP